MEPVLRIFAAFLSTSVFASLLGLGLAFASKKFQVLRDKKIEELTAALPGYNCGACSYAGCSAYAEALKEETETDTGKCTPGGVDTKNLLNRLLDMEPAEESQKMVARLACRGGDGIAVRDFIYHGYADCESARIHFEGSKACKYACLGLGSCVKSCPVDAISYTGNGLVQVDETRCIGCEICVSVCPTGVMKMVPFNDTWFVACNSRDSAKKTKIVCSAGCIGCRICERKFPESGFSIKDNLSTWHYTNEGDSESAANACPPKCIIKTKE